MERLQSLQGDMAWAQPKQDEIDELPRDQLLKKESFWHSAQSELETWKKDLSACYCELIGEYEIDEDLTLYRFELDESYRGNFVVNTPHFVNIILSKKEKRGPVAIRNKDGLIIGTK